MAENAASQSSPSENTPISQPRVAIARRTRILAGYFQPNEVQGYLQGQGLVVNDASVIDLDSRCEEARTHVGSLGARAEPIFEPLAERPHLSDLRAEATFNEHRGAGGPVEFVTIDLARLVACQPTVDMSHVESLATSVPDMDDADGLLRFCLPLQSTATAPFGRISLNGATNTFGLIVNNPDVRICGPFQAEQPGGRGLFGFAIGAGLLQMSVVSFNGRYMLNNGYHRAVALLAAGHKRVPVILVTAPGLDATPPARAGMFNPQLIFGPMPPRLEDFLSAASVDVETQRRQFLFSIHAEVHGVPAA